MNRNKVLLLATLLSLTLACSLLNMPNVGSTPNVGSAPTEILLLSPTAIPSNPVSIRAGLAGLNTYSLVIESNFSGPAQADFSQTHFEIKKSSDMDVSSAHYVTTHSSESDSEPSQNDSYA